MKISTIEKQNFKAKLFGDYKQLKKAAIALGMPATQAEQRLQSIRNLFNDSDFSIMITRPVDAFLNDRCCGAIIAANKNTVCKGVRIFPDSCKDEFLLDKYLAAAKRLATEDYTLEHNAKDTLEFLA